MPTSRGKVGPPLGPTTLSRHSPLPTATTLIAAPLFKAFLIRRPNTKSHHGGEESFLVDCSREVAVHNTIARSPLGIKKQLAPVRACLTLLAIMQLAGNNLPG